MSQDSLIRFSNAIISDAEGKRSDYLRKLKSENDELIKSKEIEYRAFYEKNAGRECTKADSLCGLTVSERRTALKRSLIRRRIEMADEIFREAAARLAEYAETEEYKKKLAAEFKEAASALGKGTLECTAREADIGVLKELSEASETVFNATEENFIGGFILKNTTARTVTDYTLAGKLEEQKAQFAINSGLTIE